MARGWNLLSLGLALLVVGCAEAAPREPEVRPVRTLVVDPKPIDDDRRAIGEVRPRYESDLGFRVAGKIVARTRRRGRLGQEGRVLARLDDPGLSQQAEVGWRRHRRRAGGSGRGAGRRGTPAPPAGQWHTPRAPTTMSRSRICARPRPSVDAARTPRKWPRDQLGYAELRADFDGIVTAVGAEAGQVVNVGQMVVRLARPDDKDAVFAIAEAAFADRRTGREPRPEIVARC